MASDGTALLSPHGVPAGPTTLATVLASRSRFRRTVRAATGDAEPLSHPVFRAKHPLQCRQIQVGVQRRPVQTQTGRADLNLGQVRRLGVSQTLCQPGRERQFQAGAEPHHDARRAAECEPGPLALFPLARI